MTKKQANNYDENKTNGDQFETRKLSIICENTDEPNHEANIVHEVGC